MIALVCFVLASPFKSKSRLEAENAALRQQLIVLRRKVRGRRDCDESGLSILLGPSGPSLMADIAVIFAHT